MTREMSTLQKARASYKPRLPKALREAGVTVNFGAPSVSVTDQEDIGKLFPKTYGQNTVIFGPGKSGLRKDPLAVGVTLSGGPAAGGHNVIAGLFDALKAANNESRVYGFLKGPGGVIKGDFRELTADIVDGYRNTGGFDMIMSGRDKIEKSEDLERCKKNFEQMRLNGLVIVGGDDSNTNAAVLAEFLRSQGSDTCVIGVPKTIDGDMRGREIETSFGYDTACRVYAELIGNICRDAASSIKYWHFIKLMGRSASHVTLECALKTHPNIALISEEIQKKGTTLEEIVESIVNVIVKRAEKGRNYGVVIVPEGLPEFISDIKSTIDELSSLLGKEESSIQGLAGHAERVKYVSTRLTGHNARVYSSLPGDVQEVLLQRDSHGNVPLSQVETERFLINLVSEKIKSLNARREKQIKFSALAHFFGYEGRCAAPSNFDASYSYSLGFTAAQLVLGGLSGYTAYIRNLIKPSDEWIAGGTPITSMLGIEKRKGRQIPVIKKAIVDTEGKPFKEFALLREQWALEDCYLFPGPIQYFGPPEVCDAPPSVLTLELAGS